MSLIFRPRTCRCRQRYCVPIRCAVCPAPEARVCLLLPFFTTNPGTCPAVALDKFRAFHEMLVWIPEVRIQVNFLQRFLPSPLTPTDCNPAAIILCTFAIPSINPPSISSRCPGSLKLQLPPSDWRGRPSQTLLQLVSPFPFQKDGRSHLPGVWPARLPHPRQDAGATRAGNLRRNPPARSGDEAASAVVGRGRSGGGRPLTSTADSHRRGPTPPSNLLLDCSRPVPSQRRRAFQDEHGGRCEK
ncbi:hypothetical protein HDV57DRAFT_310104 [Trichoderma longibrachiatum]|uniref:Uncharacterized protein n=1 Tax=Trichoderma longibrachiatum ATCC 18648 TaxID=983965 RepID=A0A2T4CBU6_TRILO|nr:hypothetical protein M440DRAFT_1158840 [Trichoderma longibrachiatum ATCC 18648]